MRNHVTRRWALAQLGGAVALPGLARAAEPLVVRAWKMPGCGCCTGWARHLEAAGFVVRLEESAALDEIKRRLGVPADLDGCHTATAGGYVVEGHVPASALARLLELRPAVVGIAVPGMPVGSPGMEGEPVERYDVIAWDGAGRRSVFLRFLGAQPLIAG